MKLEAEINVDDKVNDVEKLVKEKDKNVFDMKRETPEHKEETCKNEADEVYERKFSKFKVKRSRKLYDEVIPNGEPVDGKGLNDDVMYKQVTGGACNNDEVGIGMNPFNLVPLLHTIVAMLLISGRTLHEQSRGCFLPVCPSSPGSI